MQLWWRRGHSNFGEEKPETTKDHQEQRKRLEKRLECAQLQRHAFEIASLRVGRKGVEVLVVVNRFWAGGEKVSPERRVSSLRRAG